jgi:hypothetical protein
MSKPSRSSKHLGDSAWWYEDEGGIIAVKEVRHKDGTHIATTQVRIQWAPLLRAARRCGKIK